MEGTEPRWDGKRQSPGRSLSLRICTSPGKVSPGAELTTALRAADCSSCSQRNKEPEIGNGDTEGLQKEIQNHLCSSLTQGLIPWFFSRITGAFCWDGRTLQGCGGLVFLCVTMRAEGCQQGRVEKFVHFCVFFCLLPEGT